MINNMINNIKKISISSNMLIFLMSLYLVFILNIHFLTKVTQTTLALTDFSIPFLLSVPIFLLSLVIIFVSLFSWRPLLKPIIILLLLLSAIMFYATVNYGIIFDYGMVQNAVETDTTEALSYLNLQSTLYFLFFGVLPSVVVYLVKIKQQSILSGILSRSKLISIAIISISVIAYLFYSHYAAIGRNNRGLVKYIIPFEFIVASYKYVRNNYIQPPLTYTTLDNSPKISIKNNQQKKIIVMVVGETARAKSFAYNGYDRATNKYTQPLNVEFFNQVSSCGTATAVSVPCMFSLLESKSFNKRLASSQQNVLDIALLAGADVLWVDNNSSCKGVCKRVPTILIPTTKSDPLCDGDYCFDEVLIRELKEKLNNIEKQSTLIVLHMMGSHGPTYYRRYPRAKALFLPDCQRSDIQNCTQTELVNTYDNTIAYTDYVLAKIIKELQQVSNKTSIETTMLYVSDHGESLGENGVYLHGLPYALAPEVQTHIPLIYWSNTTLSNDNQRCQKALAKKQYSHDNIFHTLLGLMKLTTSVYQTEKDIFSQCDNQALRAKTPINTDNH